jgi:uncharacterized protein (TIGR02145 family)
MKNNILVFLGFSMVLAIGCKEEELPTASSNANNNNSGGSNNVSDLFQQGNGVTDVDGNEYSTIVINGQEWMQKNLNVSKYRNGDPISSVIEDTTWAEVTNGAYSILNNQSASSDLYGKLYNWYAVMDSRGICPTGWHVSSQAEWTALSEFLGGTDLAGGKMKSTTGWNPPNTSATNESGFTGLPGGFRDGYEGLFQSFNTSGRWWTSTIETGTSGEPIYYILISSDSKVHWDSQPETHGYSVRCIKD